ncbi:MAG TPA: helix-turn-helix domain-containing protein [Kofleriaceae bacterium]|nr:helix-turn-helix domain-containing protein [Kofleriaceae bacterium]
MSSSVVMVSDAATARAALTPLRRELLERLREPNSAASLAGQLAIPRQKLAYHLRVLEDAGLVKLVEERQRRGFVERVLVACADTFVLDPALVQTATHDSGDAQDRHASEHLVHTAAALVRDVARMREAADHEGKRLLTLTVEAELTFSTPAAFDAFTEELSDAITALAKRYVASPLRKGGRRYRLVAAAHPAIQTKATKRIS